VADHTPDPEQTTAQGPAQERIGHLNAVLRAIRNVTQLIVREKDRRRLLQGVCENLVATRGYSNAWTALLDGSGRVVASTGVGLAEGFLPMLRRLEGGELTTCGRKALSQPQLVLTQDPASECTDCPLAAQHAGRSALTARLEHRGKVYGLMCVSVPRVFVEDAEELDLLREVAADIGLALHTIELEEERNQTEAERERLIAELEAKNTELERFTYAVSHDLKSPLITIQGFLGIVQESVAKGDLGQVKEDVARIRLAAEKMHVLLDDLLELSRVGRLVSPPEDVPLEELAREAVEVVAGRIAERGVQVEIASPLPVVFADRRRLLEVLQNLVDNAVKFIGPQAEPRVEIGARRDEEKTEEIVCYVRDNGIGIDPRYHQKVFGLFGQLDPHSEGAGVGLAMAKRIVETHGGRIWVESQGPGRGSTFCFTIPPKGEPANHAN